MQQANMKAKKAGRAILVSDKMESKRQRVMLFIYQKK